MSSGGVHAASAPLRCARGASWSDQASLKVQTMVGCAAQGAQFRHTRVLACFAQPDGVPVGQSARIANFYADDLYVQSRCSVEVI